LPGLLGIAPIPRANLLVSRDYSFDLAQRIVCLRARKASQSFVLQGLGRKGSGFAHVEQQLPQIQEGLAKTNVCAGEAVMATAIAARDTPGNPYWWRRCRSSSIVSGCIF
jgi:hypothetical protein